MGRLTEAEREAVRRLSPNRTLRELAAELGVSHETVRRVLREPAATGGPIPSTARPIPERDAPVAEVA